MNDLVSLSFAILLPMAPAYLLYKTLPSRAIVKGPFKGFKVDLSGAFGGYFLLVLLTMGFISTRPERIVSRYEVWELKGKINWDQDSALAASQIVQLKLVDPENPSVRPDGTFSVQIAAENLGKGQLKFPTLLIAHPGFQQEVIDLNESQGRFGQQVKTLLRNSAAKRIAVTDAIELKKITRLPPYAPSEPSALPHEQAALTPREVQQ